jgi:hypothetical protein
MSFGISELFCFSERMQLCFPEILVDTLFGISEYAVSVESTDAFEVQLMEPHDGQIPRAPTCARSRYTTDEGQSRLRGASERLETRPWSAAGRCRGRIPLEPALLLARASELLLHLARQSLRGFRQVSARSLSGRRLARTRKKTPSVPVDAVQPTSERLARAAESGQDVIETRGRQIRIDDPFDVLRAHRALAPHDPRLNDLRWLIGDALRRLHHRAALDALRAVTPDRIGAVAPGPRSGLPLTEIALNARDKLRAAEALAGAAAWPVLRRIVIEGAPLRDCRRLIAEVTTPWRADAILADRLRCSLDALGNHLGVTAKR